MGNVQLELVSQGYGKQRVRLLKVLRNEARHDVKELEVGVRLEGDFASSYTDADNSKVVPTDTMKNVVQVLAHRHLGVETEPFLRLLAEHFLARYEAVGRVEIEASERRWGRLAADGAPHEHAFLGEAGRPVARVAAARGGAPEIESGIEDLAVLRSTGSGFAGFPRCEHTTLPETADRILATRIRARWRWAAAPAAWNRANAAVVAALLRAFGEGYSPSVQATLYAMAGAALDACPEVASISLTLPNQHYLPANLQPFGLDATGVSFVPTDEPHGQIEATVARARS